MVELGTSKKASPGASSEQRGGTRRRPPFGAIVGQQEMKRALLAVGTSDALDGVVLRGEKGTAKSTAVRALAALLPQQRAIADCPYGCPPDDTNAQCADCRNRADPPVEQRPVPFVTLPLGATRERVVGSLSVTEALSGDPEFDPGLLARANRGILYVDEVNLLDDHLVDVLLDAAAAGVNHVERDGVSVTHPAEFTLIGTMNPEEGDLRPQLRDRFALQATVTGCDDLDQRTTVVERALARDAEETQLEPAVREATERARQRLRDARERLPDVALPEQFLTQIVELCRDAGVDGHRADIATARTARALAALDRRPKVIETDVRHAAELTLPHRLQSTPFEDEPDADDVIDEHFDDSEGDAREDETQQDDVDSNTGTTETEDVDPDTGTDDAETDAGANETDQDRQGRREATDGSDEGTPGREPDQSPDEDEASPDRSRSETEDGDARESERRDNRPNSDSGASESSGDGHSQDHDGDECEGSDSDGEDDATDATPIVPGQQRPDVGDAVAPEIDPPDRDAAADAATGPGRTRATPAVGNHGSRVRTERADPGDEVDAAASIRAAATRGSERVESRDLRRSVRAGETDALVVFAVDASASMRGPLRTAKGVALELLRDAYQHRDQVALVTFAGEDAQVVLPPTDSVSHAARHLKELPSGDRTPLPAGIETAAEVLDRADPAVGVVVLVTDGRANTVDDAGSDEAGPAGATRAAARNLARQDAHVVVVDADDGGRSLTGDVTAITDAERVSLSALSAERVGAAIDRAREE